MTTADLIEKLKRYPVPSISAAVVLLCLITFYFQLDLVDNLKTRRDEIDDEAVRMEDNIVAGNNLEEQLREMKTRLEDLNSRLIEPLELAENLKYFYSFESATGVSLADLRQNTAPPPAKGGKGGGKSSGHLEGIGYTVTLSGTFAQAVAYFDELENGRRLYRLRNFQLQRGREVNQSAITLALNLELLGTP